MKVEDDDCHRCRGQEQAIEPPMEELEVHVTAQSQVHVVPARAPSREGQRTFRIMLSESAWESLRTDLYFSGTFFRISNNDDTA